MEEVQRAEVWEEEGWGCAMFGRWIKDVFVRLIWDWNERVESIMIARL